MSSLFLTVLFPLLGFIILVIGRERFSENLSAWVGVGAIGLSFLTTIWVGVNFVNQGQIDFTQHLWTWFSVAGLAPSISFHLDGLSLLMMGMITGVGFLIHVFASWYMRGEAGYARFFSYFNLFVASMLVLVLADNLALLFLGWEGVGLCSYLLIGFYYHNPANGFAAIKAFTVTRVGDVFLLIALFLLYQQFGTLNIATILAHAQQVLAYVPHETAFWISVMLFLGAAGKSAQIPLQTWLADAMAGPTPVSALIHAATMVTAGIYLICRMHGIFELTPEVLQGIAIIGAVTLIVAGCAALVQTDIKRILAYSTMSQLGYMFMAVGAEAYQAGLFHMLAHAFFKALLFLSSGAVILACHHEQNIFKMGGLRKKIPFVFACFVIGGGALAAMPWITVGFFSKDAILGQVYAQGLMQQLPIYQQLYWVGVVGAFLTSIYTFRLIWVVFFGQEKTHAHALHGITYWLPLAILLALSTTLGAALKHPVETLLTTAHIPALNIPLALEQQIIHAEHQAVWIALIGVLVAGMVWIVFKQPLEKWTQSWLGQRMITLFYAAFGFDALYQLLFVRPYQLIAKLLGHDPIDQVWLILPVLVKSGHHAASTRQTGSLREYTSSIAFAAVILLMVLIAIQII